MKKTPAAAHDHFNHPDQAKPLAYSYVRFSHPDQAKGDSLRRQTEATDDWCRCHDVCLDTSTTFRDLGRSAYTGSHRKNPDRHALAAFLKMVEDGKVPRGSYLVIENLDRLSREHIQPALLLALNLLQAGVRIVQLKPAEMVFDDGSDTLPVMMMMMELSRGHGESAIKSERVGAAWSGKKADARENGTVQTTRLPAWLEVVGRTRVGKHARGGEFRVIPERAAVVRRLFNLACGGYGLSLLVKTLTAEGVRTWGRGDGWSKAYVHKILTGRAVLGEYQPRKGAKPEGAPVPRYYPAVVDETTWHRAQGALASRKDRRGRVGDKVASLFTGLTWDAITRTRMLIAGQTRGPKGKRQKARVLTSAASMEGRAPSRSFPYAVFEAAVLSLLREVNPADVLGEEPEGESVALAGERAAVEARLKAVEAELAGDGEGVPALARAAKALDERWQDLTSRLAQALKKEATPLAGAWSEARTLLDVAKDEPSRLRLRGLLRTILEDIQVLVVRRRSHSLAAVQVNFAGGGQRDYLIHYWAAGNGREGGWEARSVNRDDAPLDLRKSEHARRLEAALREVEL